jgi:hypothetical protein
MATTTAACTVCGEVAPDKVIVSASGRRDTKLVWHEWRMKAASVDAWGNQFPRFGPAGWTYDLVTRRISHLADGTTRRYVAAIMDHWCEGDNVCRGCRDRRLPPEVRQWAYG